jgi:hypothetical protein
MPRRTVMATTGETPVLPEADQEAMFLHETSAFFTRAALAQEPELPVAAPEITFRRLRIAGLTAAQAGNLTARLSGLSPVRTGWSVSEIERLLFLRSLVDTGRVRS